jgi:hypothetical protein
MSKGFISGFEKFFTKERITIFIVFGVLVFFLAWYSGLKFNLGDSMESGKYPEVYGSSANLDDKPNSQKHQHPSPNMPSVVTNDSDDKKKVQHGSPSGYSANSVVNPSDLLPKDVNSQWTTLNPVNQGVTTPDLLQAGYHIGLDTIGQTLKNPNLQLRSDPIIPKKDIGPWNQSTYEPDLMRVPLEVGCQ